jgi:hypothetical protein
VGRFFVAGFCSQHLGLERSNCGWSFRERQQGMLARAAQNQRKLFWRSVPLGGMFQEGIPMSFRLFKTKRFALQASRAWISDEELQEAFHQMLQGQADDLGGGVWKKRLNANRHRSIVLAKGGHYWI